ncbi:hypothetical protein PAXINDRAFT_169528 [Paxillus involutus ATCC 200175]|uniref:RING-14 protein n=1 Tax=Paxillus involutus ATCC 200175 TaxID=664439 RepID=A0A0C9TX54_PAXIN|nr:hypothetical protein PAXINDRAFT_169528 [Paxillus involutus ATCC 200175]
MHFSKTYIQLLLSLPPELRDNAVEYRQLKKLINQTVTELNSLGLDPLVLRKLLEHGETIVGSASFRELGESLQCVTSEEGSSHQPTVVYEFASKSTYLEPRLRLLLKHPHDAADGISTEQHAHSPIPDKDLGGILHALLNDIPKQTDLIIPLRSDAAFFQLLTSTLSSLSEHFDGLYDNFSSTVTALARVISSTARPTTSSAPRSFSVYSLAASNVTHVRPGSGGKSDLYTWREVFQLYVEAEVFEGIGEVNRCERSVEEAEKRLQAFEQRIKEKKGSLRLSGSTGALDLFISLNFFILDVKKWQFANAEATRKILKKHAKRTALPIPSHLISKWDGSIPSPATSSTDLALIPQLQTSLPRLLVQAIGETLLPVVPHIDDYSCLICTSIAFKPIRLGCGHLFCVRCLVKLQKRAKPDCPMCRAPTVLKADRNNVDYALLNFMSDWFPLESGEKLRANEREAAQEELEELGLSESLGCPIM